MRPRIQVEAGGEFLIPFAAKQLMKLRAYAKGLGLPYSMKRFYIGQATVTVEFVLNQMDRIRIEYAAGLFGYAMFDAPGEIRILYVNRSGVASLPPGSSDTTPLYEARSIAKGGKSWIGRDPDPFSNFTYYVYNGATVDTVVEDSGSRRIAPDGRSWYLSPAVIGTVQTLETDDVTTTIRVLTTPDEGAVFTTGYETHWFDEVEGDIQSIGLSGWEESSASLDSQDPGYGRTYFIDATNPSFPTVVGVPSQALLSDNALTISWGYVTAFDGTVATITTRTRVYALNSKHITLQSGGPELGGEVLVVLDLTGVCTVPFNTLNVTDPLVFAQAGGSDVWSNATACTAKITPRGNIITVSAVLNTVVGETNLVSSILLNGVAVQVYDPGTADAGGTTLLAVSDTIVGGLQFTFVENHGLDGSVYFYYTNGVVRTIDTGGSTFRGAEFTKNGEYLIVYTDAAATVYTAELVLVLALAGVSRPDRMLHQTEQIAAGVFYGIKDSALYKYVVTVTDGVHTVSEGVVLVSVAETASVTTIDEVVVAYDRLEGEDVVSLFSQIPDFV